MVGKKLNHLQRYTIKLLNLDRNIKVTLDRLKCKWTIIPKTDYGTSLCLIEVGNKIYEELVYSKYDKEKKKTFWYLMPHIQNQVVQPLGTKSKADEGETTRLIQEYKAKHPRFSPNNLIEIFY